MGTLYISVTRGFTEDVLMKHMFDTAIDVLFACVGGKAGGYMIDNGLTIFDKTFDTAREITQAVDIVKRFLKSRPEFTMDIWIFSNLYMHFSFGPIWTEEIKPIVWAHIRSTMLSLNHNITNTDFPGNGTPLLNEL